MPMRPRGISSSFIIFRDSRGVPLFRRAHVERPYHEDAAVTLLSRVRSIAALALASLALAGTPSMVAAGEYDVILDQAKILILPNRVATIVIGNPLVADGSLQTGGMLVVTGKSYGTTNLIALDARGAVLVEHTLRVTAPREGLVTVYRGVERATYSCSNQCERSVVLGDTPDHFNTAVTQTGSRNSAAAGAQIAAPTK